MTVDRVTLYFFMLLVVLLVALLIAEHIANSNVRDPGKFESRQGIIPGQVYSMTALQQAGSRVKAYLGDGDAAWKLWNYYSWGPGGGRGRKSWETAQYWLQVAAENGKTEAQERMVGEASSKLSAKIVEYKKWLRLQAAKAWSSAKVALEKIERAEAAGQSQSGMAPEAVIRPLVIPFEAKP